MKNILSLNNDHRSLKALTADKQAFKFYRVARTCVLEPRLACPNADAGSAIDAGGDVRHEQRVLHGHHARLVGHHGAHRLAKAKHARVGGAVVPLHLLGDAAVRNALVQHPVRAELRQVRSVLLLAGEVEGPLRRERRHERRVPKHAREHLAEGGVDAGEALVGVGHAPAPGLGHEQAALPELALARLVEGRGVELVAGPAVQRVRQVQDDHVKVAVRVPFKLGLGVVDHELGARVVVGVGAEGGHVVPAELHNVPVNVHHDALLHPRVAQHLAEGGAFATTTNVNTLWVRMSAQSRLHERLVVNKLVS
mmetsp:Transcript_9778/g.18329  ORF Transcript_9778/g.18329 Transcript_9778/m.18329 type:complete len:309 (-) Transcript_9778:299-1225(-)